MNFSKLISLVAMIALISTPLFLASADAEAATTGKRSKSGSKAKSNSKAKTRSKSKSKAKSKRTHRLKKKSKKTVSRPAARRTTTKTTNRRPARNKTVTRTTRTRSNGHTTTRRTTRAQHGSHARRRTVVRHNTGHHVSSRRHRTTYHRTPRRRTVVHHHRAPARRTVVHHRSAPAETVVHHETRAKSVCTGSPIEFYVNGGLGLNSLSITEVSEGSLSGTNFRVAVGGKGELFGMELGLDGGSFAFDDGTTLSMVGANVDAKLQPKLGIVEPYVFVGLGGYSLNDNVLNEAAGSGALRAGAGADVRINNVGIGAKYTWAAYNFENDQSYENIGATTQTLSGSVSFYF